MKNMHDGRYIVMGGAIGLIIVIIISLLTNKWIPPTLGSSIGLIFGVILARCKNKKLE